MSYRNEDGYCAACKRVDLPPDRFLCRGCLDRLPDSMRRALLSTEAFVSRTIKAECLVFLGVEGVKASDIRVPPPPREHPRVKGPCECKAPIFGQKNLVTGGEDETCNKCGRIVREVYAR